MEKIGKIPPQLRAVGLCKAKSSFDIPKPYTLYRNLVCLTSLSGGIFLLRKKKIQPWRDEAGAAPFGVPSRFCEAKPPKPWMAGFFLEDNHAAVLHTLNGGAL